MPSQSRFCIIFFGLMWVGFNGLGQATTATGAKQTTQVLVIGGGASGTTAAIQAARMGARTVLVEATPWLGGMLTAAGVSAIDGNHRLPSGLWGEFRQRLYQHYGGPDKVSTGWVSNTLFEPAVGNQILWQMAKAEPNLKVITGYELAKVLMKRGAVQGATLVDARGQTRTITASVVIDATELGDGLAQAGVAYDIGMEARALTGEAYGPDQSNQIIQDFTFAATLQDFGPGSNRLLPRPANYDPTKFNCCCSDYCQGGKAGSNAQKMLDYGKLPNGKYMINWPIAGNDYYANVIELPPAERARVYAQAKAHTMSFLYFIQNELGFKNLGLAAEYPTPDSLPFIPYHRESRRQRGVVRYTLDHLTHPYQGQPLYRTGVAVGDYPVDHHHSPHKGGPSFDFPKVPSFTVPLGALLPAKVDGLIVAEKSISVSNLVNGSTRLQPCVMLIGQAAGAWAALAAQTGQPPRQVPIRGVQQALLKAGAYLQPFLDVPAAHPQFAAVQRVGSTGLLKGRGIPYQWANQTWFYPDSVATQRDLAEGLAELVPGFAPANYQPAEPLRPAAARQLLGQALAALPAPSPLAKQRPKWQKNLAQTAAASEGPLTRAQLAAWLDQVLQPFATLPVDWQGQFRGR
jgi:FAD dependent oxidoreductase